MKQKDKELLLKDLCARCPYGVMVQILYHDEDEDGNPLKDIKEINRKLTSADIVNFAININKTIESIKPYLRKMSSMTEHEKKVYRHLLSFCGNQSDALKLTVWLDMKMFDYRKNDEGLTMIESGLAIDAKEGMYGTSSTENDDKIFQDSHIATLKYIIDEDTRKGNDEIKVMDIDGEKTAHIDVNSGEILINDDIWK